MDVYQLRSFVVLAEQLHFGRAARILNLSQPALTKQIRRLEEDLGGALFERGTQGTKLSELGRHVLVPAREAVLSCDRVVEEGRQVSSGEAGRLRIGFGFHTLELVPRLIVKFRETAPRVDLSLRDMSSTEQIAALDAGQIDLGFVRLPVPKRLMSRAVIEDRLALVVSSQEPGAAGRTLADCKDDPFVMIAKERSPGFYAHVLELCARHGFHPKVVQEVREFTTAIALVRAGMGVSVIPASFQLSRFAGVVVHGLKEKGAAWTVGAVWRPKDSNPALLSFLGLVREEAKAQRQS